MSKQIEAKLQHLLDGKKMLIWGAGREGLSTYRFIRKHFPTMPLWIADTHPIDLPDDDRVTWINSGVWCTAFESFDLIFKSPGIPIHNPAVVRQKLTSQTALFLQFFREQTIGITGTKGKSTTASLLFHILKQNGKNAILLGNIGVPCLDHFDDITSDSIVVFEMSCHQLETLQQSPHVAVLLNLHEDHLDHYGDYQSYVRAKSNIFVHQHHADILIMHRDHRTLAGDVTPVLSAMDGDADIVVTDTGIRIPDHHLSLPDDATSLIGKHNRYNIAIVYYIAKTLFQLSDTGFLSALNSFQGLPHRLQWVGTYQGITYYDDSISTVCETTIQALESLPRVDTIIIGGLDRNINYLPLTDYLQQAEVCNIILLPDTSHRIRQLLGKPPGKLIFSVDCLEQAVEIAKCHTPYGGVCLLSPAAASYNQFKNFEQRGIYFQQLVQHPSNNAGDQPHNQ